MKARYYDTSKYECIVCHGLYEKGYRDPEGEQLLRDQGIDPDDSEVACDDCFDLLCGGVTIQ